MPGRGNKKKKHGKSKPAKPASRSESEELHLCSASPDIILELNPHVASSISSLSLTERTAAHGAPPSNIVALDFMHSIILAASIEDIEAFCDSVAMTQDGFNLKAFWQRAFAEGRKAGLVETAQEADKHTFEKALVLGVDQGEFKERLEWQQAGHSPACFAKKGSRRTAEVGIQVDEPLPTPMSRASVSVQVNCIPSVHADVACQTIASVDPPNKAESISSSCASLPAAPPPDSTLLQFSGDHPLQVPLAVPLVESKLMAARFDWAEDTDQTYPIFLPSPPPRHPPSPLPRPSPSPPPLPPASPPPRHLRLRPPPSPLPGHLPSPPLPPRDFSVLRSSPAPFSSLQYRSKRSAMHGSHQSRRRRRPLHIEFPRPFSEAHSPSFSNSNHRKSCGRLKGTRSTFSPGSSALDWDSDHRLHDLSRALNALGWIRVT